MATFKFTTGPDNWLGTNANETIDALAGNDILDGGLGFDTLLGNDGADFIAGGGGNDILKGGNGNDILDGGTENDQLNGDFGDDLLYGGTGVDTLNGNFGNDYLFGGADNDKLNGGAGSDALDGGAGSDILIDSDNSFNYGAINTEHDELIGGLGNDTFYGGYDLMWGGDGNDTFNVKNQGKVLAGTGNDTISLINANAGLSSWLNGGIGDDTITAGSGNDVLISGYGKDTLKGGSGNDSYVITFDDIITDKGEVGPGADTVIDSAGTDTVFYIRDFKDDNQDDDLNAEGKELDPALKFNDFYVDLPDSIENGVIDDIVFINHPDSLTYFRAWLTGNSKNNNLKGSNLWDILDGSGGNDIINAWDGDDIIFTGNGKDTINGGAGTDTVASFINFNLATDSSNVENIDLLDSPSAISATGDSNDNVLSGNKYNNKLLGGDGNDTLDGLFVSSFYFQVTDTQKITGNDYMEGGSGNDYYLIDSPEDTVKEAASTGGIDTVEFKGTIATDTYVLPVGVENLIMKEKLTEGDGNNLNNRITGNSSANILKGSYGDDYLDGDSGTDTFEGGYGDDTFIVDSPSELIKEIDGQGDDWVLSSKISLDLNNPNWGGSIENAKLTGTTSLLNVTGNAADNDLIGNNGSNQLDGRDGKDTLEGGLGDDLYFVDTLTDKLIEVGNQIDTTKGTIKPGYIDTIQSSVSFSIELMLNFENLSLSSGSTAKTAEGNANDNLIKGNELNNTLFGLDGNDILDGTAGLDTLIGGKGNDIYRLSNDGDVITELSGQGTDAIEIQDTFDLSKTTNVENLTLLGTLAVNGTGNNTDNVIIGNSAVNTLTGLNGNDTLKGGDGIDTLVGGLGADILDLTESLANRDIVKFGATDSTANTAEADRVVKFALPYDTLDLAATIKIAANIAAKDGSDMSDIKSHSITSGIIKFDDNDTYTDLTHLSITAANLNNAVNYLKNNITDGSAVAFLGTATDPTSKAAVPSTWIFQDSGSSDTLIALIGVTTATGFSTGSTFGSTTIHIV